MRIVGRLAWRHALVLGIGVGLALPLGFVFAVQRTLDLSAYARDPARSLAVVDVASHDLPRVFEDFGTSAYTAAHWELPVRRGDIETNVIALVTATPQNHGFLTPETLVSSIDLESDRWIDLSADLAYRLGVVPGDTVSVGSPPESAVDLAVRAVHAVRLDGYPDIAQIPLSVALPLSPDADYQSMLISSLAPGEAQRKLGSSFYVDRLVAAGYPGVDPPQSFADLHSHKSAESMTGLGLVLGTAVLAAAAGLAILIRECWIFARALSPTCQILADLGASPRSLMVRVLCLAAAAVASGTAVGGSVGLAPYVLGLLGPGLPPGLVVSWWVITGGLFALGVVVAGIALRRALGRPG